jgi:hypothetical protein
MFLHAFACRSRLRTCFICSLFLVSDSIRSILSRVRVTTDGVSIDNRIYWTLTDRNYSAVVNSHTLQFTAARTKSSQLAVSSLRPRFCQGCGADWQAGKRFETRTFPLFWVPKLFPCLWYQLLIISVSGSPWRMINGFLDWMIGFIYAAITITLLFTITYNNSQSVTA